MLPLRSGILAEGISLTRRSTFPIIVHQQGVHNIRKVNGCVFYPPGSRTGASGVGFCYAVQYVADTH